MDTVRRDVLRPERALTTLKTVTEFEPGDVHDRVSWIDPVRGAL
ncbi:hypothetical protein [Streptomyces yaizuensis]|uniref:Uncharacterized protein n=1 Tax=Streptomyces yaizuensis TaxID=2989713 RepID=A0ABQ5NY67_9ACTN|nr:hypothetical protein [Streptomyces sp. YSPA8]GLF95312.1 hypothetical protein SYYSPA8_13465 [Streptomyces sp. YSPA8]